MTVEQESAVVADDALDTPAENVDAPETETVTMEDTLREKYRELTAAPEDAPVEKTDERPRGPDGKFVPKDETVETPVAKEVAPVAAAPVAKEVAPVAAPVVPEDPALAKAPSSWSAKGQAAWAKADPDIRAEALKRENDFHKGIENYRKKAELFEQIDTKVRPYEAMIRARGTDAVTVIGDSLNFAYRLATGAQAEKIQVLLGLADTYDVDLTMIPTVQEKLASGQPLVDPQFTQLQQQFNTLSETLAQREQREKEHHEAQERAEMESIQTELRTWAVTKPHYETVKLDMAALLESGRAKDFDDAYNKATWAHPDVRATLLAEQQAAERAQAAEKAAAAKKASSTNVKPRGTPPAKPANKVGTMDDTLKEAYRKITQA